MDETPGNDIDSMMASMKMDASDTKVFFNVLAAKLEGAIPDAVTIEREGGFFKKDHPIKSIKLTLGEDVFEASLSGGTVHALHSHAVRGITLRSEELSFDDWQRRLLEILHRSAETSSGARAALESLIN